MIVKQKRKIETVADLIKPRTQEKRAKEKNLHDLIKPPTKYLYECHCIYCKGKKVDARTQEKHTKEKSSWKSKTSRKRQENAIEARKKKRSITSNVNQDDSIEEKKFKKSNTSNVNPTTETADPDIPDIHALFLGSNPSTSRFYAPMPEDERNNDDYFDDYNNNLDDGNNYDDDEYYFDNDNSEDDDSPDEGKDDDENNIDREGEGLFASPEIDSDEIFEIKSLNDSIASEIILWIFKFQQRFKIPDTALESLIKFLRTILMCFDKLQFNNFPTSLYKAKKLLSLFEPKMQLTVCNNCHKLHNTTNVITYQEEGEVAIMNCLNEEFPNNPIPSHRSQCNNPLSVLKRNKGKTIAVPRMLYPKPSIRQQLSMLYQRPGFEEMLKLAASQRAESNTYSDIYDGKVWKTFPFDGSIFFTKETATTHLGILLNLDWFQPFEYTQHSTGAIYASVCNLPRSERNKPENIIYLGFLPGPKEVGLERINHYLAPIVDELLELWKGWRVAKTFECSQGLDIKVALIVESSDTPATRKLFGHGSAVMKCYRCEKRSSYSHEYRKTHYGGMEDYDEWVTRPADAQLHKKYAHEWLECSSKGIRNDHFKEYGVHWSELLRLPYMDPIRFAVVDPMHCLFLGVAKWIIRSIFIDQKKLTMEQLRTAQNRMENIELPSDIGRIPPKIAIGNSGFSNLTADQWKTFIMIYSTTILWDMLDNNDRKILGHFVRACNLLVARIITEDDLKEAQERLKDMAHLIEHEYGPEFITSNIHLSFHIPDCCRDYGPIYSFWLFPFERLNGYIGMKCSFFFQDIFIDRIIEYKKFLYLGSYPNSNRQIEPELMKIVLKNALVDYHLTCKWSSGILEESLSLLMPKKDVGSLALTTEREELQHFLAMSHNMSTKIYGTEPIPGRMVMPSNIGIVMPSNLRRILCGWYAILYEKDQEDILGFMDLQVNQYARLQIGEEIFGSMMSGRHEKNASILAKWKAVGDESIDIYPGKVQYYFEHTLRLPEGPKKHLLAYVKWYKSAPSSNIRFKHSFMEPDVSNTELWRAEYYQEGCDSLLAVHRILCRATEFKYVKVGKQNYVSIVPLNRKYNL
jgi:Transposase family tnp2